jgi:hypothetical protein
MRIKNFFNFSKKKEDLKKYNLVIKYIFSDVNEWSKNRVNTNPLLYKSNLKIEEFANLLDYGIDQDSFLEYQSSYYIDREHYFGDTDYEHRINLNINELDRSEYFLRLAYFLVDELDISKDQISIINSTGAYGRRTGYYFIAYNLSKKDIDSISKIIN